MENDIIKNELRLILEIGNPNARIPNDTIDLFDPECGITPVGMLYACMELKKKYTINYNFVLDKVDVYSLDNMASAICAQIC